jgi:CheY-like chemotaxis protein
MPGSYGNDNDPRQSEPRQAVLVGFPKGLEDALTVLLASRSFAVRRTPSASKAIELFQSLRPDLVVASNRCSAASVLELTDALGQPRDTRVIVLIAGHDREAEQRYRDAGLQHVLSMPVNADELLRAGS